VGSYVWVLVVLVAADGEWRDWKSFARREECEEILPVLIHHREDKIQARCEQRLVEK
jgi:hypothetical protein